MCVCLASAIKMPPEDQGEIFMYSRTAYIILISDTKLEEKKNPFLGKKGRNEAQPLCIWSIQYLIEAKSDAIRCNVWLVYMLKVYILESLPISVLDLNAECS